MIFFRTLILYIAVVVSLRIMGKRQLGELQPSELVVAIMISDLASVPMQDIDIPLLTGIIPVITLIMAEVLLSFIALKSKWARKVISGEPSIIIYNGKIIEKELRKLRFNLDDLISELRFNGSADIRDVEVAVVETSGKLSIIQKQNASAGENVPFMVISDGSINEEEVKRSGRTISSIKKELEKQGIKSIKKVFIASISDDGSMFVQEKEK
ncbi:MAG: DUF421 domain-containing protein [Clostridia bacterium]|nr:DUF421 domain-containing protein [Clostridia bacterium]